MNDIFHPTTVDNLAILRGAVVADPLTRELPAGGVVAQFDLTTRVDTGGRAVNVSVPIAWPDPPARSLDAISSGTDVVIIGTVRRRFFRVGGATQSRTEVHAEQVIAARRHKQVDAALAIIAERLLAR